MDRSKGFVRSLVAAIVVTAVVVVAAALVRVDHASAASKYDACSLLQATEWERVVGKKVEPRGEGERVMAEGLAKRETFSHCEWTAGTLVLALTVGPAPLRPDQWVQAVLGVDAVKLRQFGGTYGRTTVGGTACHAFQFPTKMPGGGAGGGGVVGCTIQRRGVVVFPSVTAAMGTGARLQVSPEQVKGVADKAASRLR